MMLPMVRRSGERRHEVIILYLISVGYKNNLRSLK